MPTNALQLAPPYLLLRVGPALRLFERRAGGSRAWPYVAPEIEGLVASKCIASALQASHLVYATFATASTSLSRAARTGSV